VQYPETPRVARSSKLFLGFRAGLTSLEENPLVTRPIGINAPFRLDPDALARAVAADLRELYGTRLRGVVLFGSWARKDAHPDSDIDLLVVLDRVDSVWEELRRMEPILWRHSLANDAVVSATPVAVDDLRSGRWPLLRRVQAQGRQIA
jgi:predicted nucleotidyltransferase